MVQDTGIYNKDNKLYAILTKELYEQYPDGITLPPEYAQFAHENLLQVLIRLSRYKFVSRLMRKTDNVLEIGSGSGLGAIFIGQHCKSITGIEIKETELDEARRINTRSNVRFRKADFFKVNNKKRYNAIVALDVIEHLPYELGEKLIAKTCSHLKQDGFLVVGTPSIYSYEYQGKLSKASHVKCYDQQELVELMESYYRRVIAFSMNDEVVHTGHPKMAWYYLMLAFYPRKNQK
jgi:2-polyprenyl-3-methyl-5-hydroxy-6-metoxy-1,4-benzoquinol methylase